MVLGANFDFQYLTPVNFFVALVFAYGHLFIVRLTLTLIYSIILILKKERCPIRDRLAWPQAFVDGLDAIYVLSEYEWLFEVPVHLSTLIVVPPPNKRNEQSILKSETLLRRFFAYYFMPPSLWLAPPNFVTALRLRVILPHPCLFDQFSNPGGQRGRESCDS